MAIAGIKYETDARGKRRFVRIDLKRFGKNKLLEDFLDGMEAESRKDEPSVPWQEAKVRLNKKYGIK